MPSSPSKDSPSSSSPKSSGASKKSSPSTNGNRSNSKSPAQSGSSKEGSKKSLHNPLSALHKSSKGKSSGGNDLSDEAILAGAAAGAALLLFFLIICMVCCCCKRKKRKPKDDKYNKENAPKSKNNGYYAPQQQAWNHQQPAWNQQRRANDVHLKMPPSLASGPTTSEQGWVAGPPPPPPPMSSRGDMTTSSCFGPYQAPLPPPHPGMAIGFNKSTFTYEELATATQGFDRSLLLGQGGFGYVYKGVLSNGKEVAVKSLKDGSGQGEREFQAEVEIISRVHHRHLVSLVGYCSSGQQRMLVYEFIPNNTLEYHLHGKGRPVVDCSTRLKIALGAAKGFAYLHEDCNPRIIHRDIKAANILIDNQYEAKVADFGLAKLSSDTNTHVSTRIMGTFGYLAPEYASTGKLTEKSDVFSYGVVLLELITGKRPVDPNSDDDSLIDWARPILMEASDGGSFEEMVDERLEGNYNREEMHRMVACAAACIRHSAKRRPKMSQIVRVLEGDVSLDDLNEAGKKVQATKSSSSDGSFDYDMHSYNGGNRRYKWGSMSSQEFSSGEQGTLAGESLDVRPRNRNP